MLSEALSVAHATPVGELLSGGTEVKIFESDTLLKEVFDHFIKSVSDIVLFVDDELAIGVMTLKDMIRSLTDYGNLARPAKEFMTTPIQVFDQSESIGDILDQMQDLVFDKIVVSTSNGDYSALDRRHLLSFCYQHMTPLIEYESNVVQSLLGLVEKGEQGLLEMATTDALTGLGNRRLLEQVFKSHQKIEETLGVSLYLLMFDIDDFKQINDTFGHAAGDSVLKEMAQLIKRSIRKSDILVRWGGEEFIILLYYNDGSTAVKIAENLRQKIDEYCFEKIIHATCSFGMTPVMAEESLQEAVERADKALYRAKADGKNCVRIESV